MSFEIHKSAHVPHVARHTLTHRLTRAFGGMFFGVLLVLSLGVFLLSCGFLLDRQKTALVTSTELIADHIVEELHEGDPITRRAIMEEQNTNTALNLYLLDDQGRILNQVVNFHVKNDLLSSTPGTLSLRFSQDRKLLLCFERQVLDGEAYVCQLYAILNLETEKEFLSMLGVLLLGANLIGLLAALLVGRTTSQRMLQPIDAMITATRAIGGTSLTERLEVPPVKDELQALALTINDMLDRLQGAFQAQGRFVADASHELRTPLSILQGNADMLLRWGREDETVLEDSIAAIGRQTEYMHKLVENLLFLARSDGRPGELNKSAFPLEELLEELREEQALMHPQHHFLVQCPSGLTLCADQPMIRQLFHALLDNSVKYTPPEGTITLQTYMSDRTTVLQVADTGIGMEEAHLNHIFERFYRVDKMRTRSTGGTGLGLSIVAAIATAHGGTVSATSSPGKGTTITVKLPSA